MAHDAATASATEAEGPPGRPNTTLRPPSSSTAVIQVGAPGHPLPYSPRSGALTGSVEILPRGSTAATSEPGLTRHGSHRARATRVGEAIAGPPPAPFRGGRRAGPRLALCSSRAPAGERGLPRAPLATSAALNPARSMAATTEPADVPTITSAARGSHPVICLRADRTPAWKAWPTTPPAPRTRPTRAIALSYPMEVPKGHGERAPGLRRSVTQLRSSAVTTPSTDARRSRCR